MRERDPAITHIMVFGSAEACEAEYGANFEGHYGDRRYAFVELCPVQGMVGWGLFDNKAEYDEQPRDEPGAEYQYL